MRAAPGRGSAGAREWRDVRVTQPARCYPAVERRTLFVTAVTNEARRIVMLLAAIYTTRNPTEESQKRSLQLFTNWQPPSEFKAHYTRADGKGGIALFEAEDASVALEMVAPFTAFFDFEITPVVNIEDAVPVFFKTTEWAESVA